MFEKEKREKKKEKGKIMDLLNSNTDKKKIRKKSMTQLLERNIIIIRKKDTWVAHASCYRTITLRLFYILFDRQRTNLHFNIILTHNYINIL